MNMLTEQSNNPPHPEPDRTWKRPRPIFLVCMAALLIALIGGSGMFWLLHNNNGGNHATAVKPTLGASPSLTPTWSPTEITPPPQSSFYETFVNNNHGWSLSGEAGYFRILANDSLILADTNPSTTLVESVPTSTSLDNYAVSVDFTMNQGDGLDSTGLYLRGDSNLDHDYRVDINGNNTFDVAREQLDANQQLQTTMLFAPQSSSDLRPEGQSNTLTVIMLGSTIAVSFNGVLETIVTDSSYTDGQVALFVHHGDNSPKGITVSFTQVEVDRLSSPLATPVPTSTPTPP